MASLLSPDHQDRNVGLQHRELRHPRRFRSSYGAWIRVPLFRRFGCQGECLWITGSVAAYELVFVTGQETCYHKQQSLKKTHMCLRCGCRLMSILFRCHKYCETPAPHMDSRGA